MSYRISSKARCCHALSMTTAGSISTPQNNGTERDCDIASFECRPIELIATPEGIQQVLAHLERLRYGGYT
ncbi:MAG: DUF2384 domain-containing protein [Alcaligenaceae bacterium]|nr:MAG: DUF2384 domain-containing protein [Alcaligenaceae bacterium]